MKLLFVLRGLPGSGKSTFIKNQGFQPILYDFSVKICNGNGLKKQKAKRFLRNPLGKGIIGLLPGG